MNDPPDELGFRFQTVGGWEGVKPQAAIGSQTALLYEVVDLVQFVIGHGEGGVMGGEFFGLEEVG